MHKKSPISGVPSGPQSPISGKTNLVGLIGWPVSHSVSPAMHNAAFADLGLDWCYVPLLVPTEPAERIGEAVRGLRALGMRGANVTVPHKQAVMPYLDQLSPAAEVIGAVNTIRLEPDGTLWGDNTDAPGFVADLRDHGVEPAGKAVLVLGAGGSARAIVYGLAAAGSRSIAICNRTLDRAQSLAGEMQRRFPALPITAHGMPDEIAAVAGKADLIVNTTSLGMTPKTEGLPWVETVPFLPGQVVYDLVYNPPQTRLLQKAALDGAWAIGGLGMLIWQGAIAFERWTGQPPSINVMRRAALADLTARGVLAKPAPNPRVQVRRAVAADAPALISLNADVQQLHADALPHLFKQPTPDTWPTARIVELLSQPGRWILLAERDGEPIGYLYAEERTVEQDAARHAQRILYIHHLAVRPSAQGQAAGRLLIAEAKAMAQAWGAERILLDTWAFNAKARHFFESQGFETFNYRMWKQIRA